MHHRAGGGSSGNESSSVACIMAKIISAYDILEATCAGAWRNISIGGSVATAAAWHGGMTSAAAWRESNGAA